MRDLVCFIFVLANINLFAQTNINIMDFKIIPLDVFIDENDEYHNFDDLFNAYYGIYVKLSVSSVNADTLLTSKNNFQLIEVGSERILFHHWGNDIVMFSEMNINDSMNPVTYIMPKLNDTVCLFLYGGFSNVLYDLIRKKVKCIDCNEVILRNPKKIERWIRKKTRLRILYGNGGKKDVKCGKVCLIVESGMRNNYLSLWNSMIRYHNILTH